MVTLRITADVPSSRQLTITLPSEVPIGETELEIRVASGSSARKGVPGALVRGIAAGTGPLPADETIEKWIADHRTGKYG